MARPEAQPTARPRAVCIVGPTAVGKTALLVRLFGGRGELISADSMQVYRGMDIGTAKPPAEVRAELPHHLIDIANPDESFTVGDFVQSADRLVPEIAGRGAVPIISGGTAFYLRGYLYGVPETPPSDPEIHRQVQARLREQGNEALHDELSRIDPESAERMGPSDSYRIVRALEVYYASGQPRSAYTVPQSLRDDIDVLVIGLDRDRAELYRRVDERVEGMFDAGLIDEVRRLLQRGYAPGAPGMRAIGYREVVRALAGEPVDPSATPRPDYAAPISPDTEAELRRLVMRNSRRYAKRQLTFFRAIPEIEWYHADDLPGINERVERFLRRGSK